MERERKHFPEGKQMDDKAQQRPEKRLLNVEETAAYLGLAARTIYNQVAPKAKVPFPIKPKRMGKLVRFDIRDLERYVDTLDR
jgi:predicted DNA-binding transcriptional regulator AlpA